MEGAKSESDGLKKAKLINPAPRLIVVQTFTKKDASDNYTKVAYEYINGEYIQIDTARAHQLWQAAV